MPWRANRALQIIKNINCGMCQMPATAMQEAVFRTSDDKKHKS